VAAWAARHGVAADVAITGLAGPPVSPDLGSTLYRVVQEALMNVARHARAGWRAWPARRCERAQRVWRPAQHQHFLPLRLRGSLRHRASWIRLVRRRAGAVMHEGCRMRKRLTTATERAASTATADWLDLERVAAVEITSEDPAYPIEAALLPGHAGSGAGWRAASPGTQAIRVVFDEPRPVRRIRLHFVEPAEARTQEFVLRWSADGGRSFRDVVRQQWNFSPRGATAEAEDYRVDLPGVTVLELVITPDIGEHRAPASLAQFRIA
jgi:hypothetical protein